MIYALLFSLAASIVPPFDTDVYLWTEYVNSPSIEKTLATPISATSFLAGQSPSKLTSPKGVSFCWKKTMSRPYSFTKPCPPGSDTLTGFGVCYPKCPTNFDGFGPVCWSKCPANLPYSCGGSCTASLDECTSSLYTQLSVVAEVAYNVAAVINGGQGTTMALKELSKFTTATTKAQLKSELKKILGSKIANVDQVAEGLAEEAFGGKKFDWKKLAQMDIQVIVDAFYRPLCQPQ